MQDFPKYVEDLRKEARLLRVHNERLTRAHQSQKQKGERLDRQLKEQTRRIKELERENERLKRENEDLKQQQEQTDKTKNRYQVALFDHGNFRHPTPGPKKSKEGQRGHADTNRERSSLPSPQQTRRLFAPCCGTCSTPLARVGATRRKWLVDIVLHPQVVSVLLESERQWCGTCKREVCARDEGSLPFSEYGLNVFLLVLILRFRSHTSLHSIAEVLSISHGLRLAPSTISNLLAHAKEYLRGTYDHLLAAVRAGDVMYADETGWLVNGQKAWMWLLANEEVTVYFAAESRGGGIARDLCEQSQALCMHDGYAAYTKALPTEQHLYGWAHLLRFAYEETIFEPPDSQAVRMRQHLVRAYHRRDDLASVGAQQVEVHLRTDFEQLLAVQSEQASIGNIQTRLRVQAEGLIRALLCTPDGTNNLAERELRPMVLMRKRSNGSNTFAGMETSAVVGSVLQTLAKQDAPLLDCLRQTLQVGVQEHSSQYRHPVAADFS